MRAAAFLTTIGMPLALAALLGCSDSSDLEGGPSGGEGGGAGEGAGGSYSLEVKGQLDEVDGLRVLRVWGTAEEIGYAEGALLCGRIRDTVQDFLVDFLPSAFGTTFLDLKSQVDTAISLPAADQRILEGMLLGMQERCPPDDLVLTSDNLEPEAGGSRELTYDDLVYASACFDTLIGCSSFSVWGPAAATGGTLHARNTDLMTDPQGTILGEHLLKVVASDELGGTWASLTWPGSTGCATCFTEQGAGLDFHASNTLDSETPTGNTSLAVASRNALLAAASTADPLAAADAVLDASPQIAGGNLHLYLPCSQPGCVGGAVLEYDGHGSHADGRSTIRHAGDPNDGGELDHALVCTNHYRTRVDQSAYADGRYQALAEGVQAAQSSGGLDVAGSLALIHQAAELNSVQTMHSLIMDTQSQEVRLFVAPDDQTDATEVQPVIMALDQVFSTLPD